MKGQVECGSQGNAFDRNMAQQEVLDVDVYHLIRCFGETEIRELERTTGPFG